MNPDHELPDYGYDPALDAGLECPPVHPIDVPPSATVTQAYLPPVGQQGTDQHPGAPATCTAWASTYGLATFTAAKRTQTAPANDALSASPAYIYYQVRQQMQQPPPPCKGSSFTPYFDILARTGTANLHDAPYYTDCDELAAHYKSFQPAPDPRFHLTTPVHCVQTADLIQLKQLLASDCPIAYGTHLYPGWGSYRGDPPVYSGSGPFATGANGQPVLHCMLIIGYDDGMGAFHIQNSQGTAWGAGGYVWMDYQTFQRLAEPVAFYYPG